MLGRQKPLQRNGFRTNRGEETYFALTVPSTSSIVIFFSSLICFVSIPIKSGHHSIHFYCILCIFMHILFVEYAIIFCIYCRYQNMIAVSKQKRKASKSASLYALAEKVGFEPTCRLRDNLISSQGRYNHFDTSPHIKLYTFYSFVT